MSRHAPNISDDAICEATGRTWSEWLALLDEHGAETLTHKQIVGLVRNEGHIESIWWQQSVATGYEKLKGLRKLGEAHDGYFQSGLRRTVAIPHDTAWRLLVTPECLRVWLGTGPIPPLEKGATYRLTDGTHGEVRIYHPKERLRITWQPEGWARASTIQIRIEPKGNRTTIAFHQENLPTQAQREERRQAFKAAIETLEVLAAN